MYIMTKFEIEEKLEHQRMNLTTVRHQYRTSKAAGERSKYAREQQDVLCRIETLKKLHKAWLRDRA